MKKRILIIDDDTALLTALKWQLKKRANVLTADNPAEAERLIAQYKPDIILLDVHLNLYKSDYTDSLKLLKKLKQQNSGTDKQRSTETPFVIIITVETDTRIKRLFLKNGADKYVNKPITSIEEVLDVSI